MNMAIESKVDELPLENIDWEPLVSLLGEANRQLARFDGILRGVPEPQILLSPLSLRAGHGRNPANYTFPDFINTVDSF